MLFLGWGADLLLGSSPWGLVGGIVIGSIIGFIQFFRITSQIFNNGEDKNAIRPLLAKQRRTMKNDRYFCLLNAARPFEFLAFLCKM